MGAKKERILIVSEDGLFSESIKNLLLHAKPGTSVRILSCEEATPEAVTAFRPEVAIVVQDKAGKGLEPQCISLIHTLESRVILCTLEDNLITILRPKHLVDAGVEGLIAAVWEEDHA